MADECFSENIVRGLGRRSEIDVVRARDLGLGAAADSLLLQWASEQGRVVLSHDVSTMTRFAYERLAGGLPMRGLVMVRSSMSPGDAVAEIMLIAECASIEELNGQVWYVPLH